MLIRYLLDVAELFHVVLNPDHDEYCILDSQGDVSCIIDIDYCYLWLLQSVKRIALSCFLSSDALSPVARRRSPGRGPGCSGKIGRTGRIKQRRISLI